MSNPTTQTLPKTDAPGSGGEDNPTLHCFCGVCYPASEPGDVAFCGHKSPGGGPTFDADGPVPVEFPLCVVCEDLIPDGCRKCGSGR